MTCLLYAVAIKEAKTGTGIACMHTPRFLVPLMMNRRAEEKHTHTLPPPETLLIAKPPPEEESQKEKNTLLKLFRTKSVASGSLSRQLPACLPLELALKEFGFSFFQSTLARSTVHTVQIVRILQKACAK